MSCRCFFTPRRTVVVMTPALFLYVTTWTVIGSLLAFGAINTFEAWNNRRR